MNRGGVVRAGAPPSAAMDPHDVHGLLLSVVDPRRTSTAGIFVMGLTKDALRPRSDAGRGRRRGVKKTQPGRGDSSGNRLRGTAMGEAAVLRLHQRSAHGRKTQLAQGEQRQWESCDTGSGPAYDVTADRRMEKDAARPKVNNVSGRAARREAASLLASADRRMAKLRPGCVSAMPQSMRSQPGRQTCLQRAGALRPTK